MNDEAGTQKISFESASRIGGLLNKWRVEGDRTHEDLASDCFVTQGQISRILAGKFTKLEGAVLKLCEMAGIDPYTVTDGAQTSMSRQRLHKALEQCWDGSKEQADTLINLLQTAGKLTGKQRQKVLG